MAAFADDTNLLGNDDEHKLTKEQLSEQAQIGFSIACNRPFHGIRQMFLLPVHMGLPRRWIRLRSSTRSNISGNKGIQLTRNTDVHQDTTIR
jgi:hypothetical protein